MTEKFIDFEDDANQEVFLKTESIEYFYIFENVKILDENNYVWRSGDFQK